MTTHISDSQAVHSSDTASDVLSEVLKLPEPAPPKRKRKPGFNTEKAVTISDTSFSQNWKRKRKLKRKKRRPKKLRNRGEKRSKRGRRKN